MLAVSDAGDMPRGDDDSADPPQRRSGDSLRGDIKDLEHRVRELEAFKANVGGGHGAPSALQRIEDSIAGLRRDVEEDLRVVKATQDLHARKLESHDHVFGKVMIAAVSGGAVVGVLVNLLFQIINK